MPGPSSVTRTTTCAALGPRRHRDPTVSADRIERVVDQVRPHLIQLAAEAAHARQIRRQHPPPATPTSPAPSPPSPRSVSVSPLRDVHRLGRRRLIHVGEALHRAHQLVHARRRPLDVARQPTDGAPGRHPAERRPKLIPGRPPLASSSSSASVTSVSPAARRGHRPARDPAASRRSPPRDRRARAVRARRSSARRCRPGATRSTTSSARSSRSAAPSARDASSDSAKRLGRSSCALRAAADAGLFSSCASPAASLPSDAIFSTCRSLTLNARARSTITCTSAAVTWGHSIGSAGRCSRATRRISVGSWITELPGALASREYGSSSGHVAVAPVHRLAPGAALIGEVRHVARRG